MPGKWPSPTYATAAACLLAAGCAQFGASNAQLRPLDLEPQHKSVAITYRLRSAPPKAAAGAPLASNVAPVPAAQRSQVLSIQYPHPLRRPGYALAEVVVARDPAEASATPRRGALAGFRRLARDRMPGLTYGEGIQSAWALDVPAAEVDRLIQQLARQGYLQEATSVTAGADLSARLDGLTFAKSWASVPELNSLVHNIRRQGRLVSHGEPLEPPAARIADVQLAVGSAAAAPAAQPVVVPAVYQEPGRAPRSEIAERLPRIE